MTVNKSQGFGRNVPPLVVQVQIYFDQQHMTAQEAEQFLQHYEDRNWTYVGGQLVRDWKEEANKWIWEILAAQPWRRVKSSII